MNKEVLLVIFLVLFGASLVSADEYRDGSLTVSVDVLEPYALIEISPSSVYLGQVSPGYESAVQNITARNLGTLNARIQPRLSLNASDFFNYLQFASASCSSWSNISKWTSSIIYGNGKSGDTYHFCMKLDLGDYDQEIGSDVYNLTTDLTFVAMPA
ncbi:Uncharacterised protein [uncultured archaeon]|nr:Uncharacterised protein [uncultured archaeon]